MQSYLGRFLAVSSRLDDLTSEPHSPRLWHLWRGINECSQDCLRRVNEASVSVAWGQTPPELQRHGEPPPGPVCLCWAHFLKNNCDCISKFRAVTASTSLWQLCRKGLCCFYGCFRVSLTPPGTATFQFIKRKKKSPLQYVLSERGCFRPPTFYYYNIIASITGHREAPGSR